MSVDRRPSRRVVVFTADFAPHMGGVERFTESLWSRMAERGWDVMVLTTTIDGAAPVGTVKGLRVIRLPAWRLLEGRVPLPKPSPALCSVLHGLQAVPPDVIVSNTRFFPTSALAAVLARRTGRPLFHIEHGSASVTLGRPVVDRLTAIYDRVVGGWVVRSADRCAGVSRAAADFVSASFGVASVGILPNGVETTGWDHVGVDYRELLELRPDETLIAFAGRLIEAKGVLDLIAAFRKMKGHVGRDVRLAIAGEGPLESVVQRSAEEDRRIVALGRLQQERVHDLLIAADIVAQPSGYPEGLPSVLLEAAAAGTAIVATPAGGTTDLVRAGDNGLLVPFGDSGALVRALDALDDDRGLRERLGAAARRTVRERFDWRTVADTLEGELAGMLPPRGSCSSIEASAPERIE